MSVIVKCPQCRKKYRVGEAALGQRLKCSNCGQAFDATAQPPPAGPATVTGSGLACQRKGEVMVVRITTARIGTDNVEELGADLLALAADPANKKMILHLGDVEFLFSTALGKIVALEKRLQQNGGVLRLCALQPVVRETMESAGLTILLDVYDDEEQALEGF